MQNITKDMKLFWKNKNYRGLIIFFLIPFICEIIFFSVIFPEPTPFYFTHSLHAVRTGISIIMLYLAFKGSKIALVITFLLGVHSFDFIFGYLLVFVGIFLNS